MAAITVLRKGAMYNCYDDLSSALSNYQVNSKMVGTANKKVPAGKEQYVDKFKHSNIVYGSKHYGTTRMTGISVHPEQRSYEVECPFKLKVIANRALGSLVVYEFEEKHNHDISSTIYKTYPEQRRLEEIHTEQAQSMMEMDIKPSKVSAYLHQISGKTVTSQDIRNLKKSKDPADLQFLQTLEEIVYNDVEADVEVTLDQENVIDYIYIQTGQMKKNFANFPEIMVMDCTYKLNNKNMHLATIMVIDGEGHGRVAAHCLLARENQEIYTKFLGTFVEKNGAHASKIEVSLVDKDFKEIGALARAMPGVPVHICAWHTMCAIRRKLMEEKLPLPHF